jgi:hypothetical protein|tara:strand:+ start:8452 stop:9243 length:792 start_codon:yes stop_codon:yes gene_type:complete
MSSIIAFPSTLAAEVTKGGHHVSFEIIGKEFDQDVFKIHLFVPSGFNMADGANFGNIDLGTIAASTELLKNKEANVTDLEATAIGTALMSKLGIGGDLNVAAAENVKNGIVLNNQSTLTYEGSSIRTFDLSFVLVASSAKEAEMIRVIEHTFRKYMYAKKEGAFALKYPPLFRIKFMKGKKVNEFMPFMFDSYLTGMATSYNNNANMFHKDGSPTDLTINLSFQEQRQLTRDDLYHVPAEGGQERPPSKVQQKFDYPAAKTGA